MPRLFVAIRPPPAIRDALIDNMDFGVEGARWQDEDQLHLTLRFIGDVNRHTGEDIVAALAGIRAAPVAIALAGLGTFDKRGRLEALWIGAGPREPLTALHRKIDHALVRAGLAPERRAFMPHVTLARVGRGVAADCHDWLAAHATFALPSFTAEEFELVESTLSPGGAEYETAARYALQPPPPL